jgi:hypothetical protein
MVNKSGSKSRLVEKDSYKEKIENTYEKHRKQINLFFRRIIFVFLVIRGIFGYWSDLKNYIIKEELDRPVVEVANEPEKEKKKDLKKKIFKEKGIIFTDEEIEKYRNGTLE